MRQMQMLALLLIIFSFVTGCRFARDAVPGVSSTYQLLEDGQLRRLKTLTIRYRDPLRDLGFNSRSTYLLDELPPRENLASLNKIIRHTARHRVLVGQGWRDPAVSSLADWLSQDQPNDHHRWIIGNRPVVVAVEPDAAPKPHAWGATPVMRLVRENDMGRRVGKILVLENWPKEVRREAGLPEARRVIELDPPRTLREVYAAPPWLPPVAHEDLQDPNRAVSSMR